MEAYTREELQNAVIDINRVFKPEPLYIVKENQPVIGLIGMIKKASTEFNPTDFNHDDDSFTAESIETFKKLNIELPEMADIPTKGENTMNAKKVAPAKVVIPERRKKEPIIIKPLETESKPKAVKPSKGKKSDTTIEPEIKTATDKTKTVKGKLAPPPAIIKIDKSLLKDTKAKKPAKKEKYTWPMAIAEAIQKKKYVATYDEIYVLSGQLHAEKNGKVYNPEFINWAMDFTFPTMKKLGYITEDAKGKLHFHKMAV